MLFKPYLAEAILQGKKTQTRRLPTGTNTAMLYNNYTTLISVYQNRRLRWRIGNTYAIQPGRGKKAIGRFRLLNVHLEPLQAITSADARAEGLDYACPIKPFARLWNDIHTAPGTRWKDNPQVFVLTFELVTK